MSAAGSVSVADDGTVTKSGLAGGFYDAIVAQESTNWPDPNVPSPDFTGTAAAWADRVNTALVKVKQGIARQANALASGHYSGEVSLALSANDTNTLSATPKHTNLALAVKSGETWMIDARLSVSCSGAGGVKLGATAPGGSTVYGHMDGASSSATAYGTSLFNTGNNPVGVVASSTGDQRVARVTATITAGADGNIGVCFAPVTNGQTATILARSRMRASRVNLV